MCPNVPTAVGGMCPDVPPIAQAQGTKPAQMCPIVPESAPGDVADANCRTNPPRLRPLSDAQHAAIRMLLGGMGSKAIARALGLNHHTIGRWKRDPRFAAQLEAMRAKATEYAIIARATRGGAPPVVRKPVPSSASTRSPAPAPERPTLSDDADDQECETMIARILARRRD